MQHRFGARRAAPLAFIAALMAAGAAVAQPLPADQDPNNPFNRESRAMEAGRRVGEIVTQPVRDINLDKTAVPIVLVEAFEGPYDLYGARTCEELTANLRRLDEALGADFVITESSGENRAGKLAEAGGRAIVNSLIPFRGLVREVSGAAPAERRYNAAVEAGLARRGFLRGIQYSKNCAPRPPGG